MPRGVLQSLVVCRKLSMNSWPAPPDMAVHVDGEVVLISPCAPRFVLFSCPVVMFTFCVLLSILVLVLPPVLSVRPASKKPNGSFSVNKMKNSICFGNEFHPSYRTSCVFGLFTSGISPATEFLGFTKSTMKKPACFKCGKIVIVLYA